MAQGRRAGRAPRRPRDGQAQARRRPFGLLTLPDPAATLERASALAFAGRLRAASRDLDRLGETPPPRLLDRSRWLRAYLLAATGAFDGAERVARSLLASSRDRRLRAASAVTLGSVLRQTGRHAEAGEVEAAALADASTAGLRRHLSIGLAADAVGLGDLAGVDRALARAGPEPAGGWRAGVRLCWVRCERELLAGRPAAAVAHARRALARSVRAGARRHEAKSLLFLGVALREVVAEGGPGEAAAHAEAEPALRRARAIATRIGARPVAEVAGTLIGARPARR